VGTAHTSNLRNPVSLSARAPLPTLRTATL